MVVSKIFLPADFGIENLDCPVHGNIEVNLMDNQKMKANSMILGVHSPVFQNMFFNLGLTTVDAVDFSPDIVRVFLGSLYSGRVEITKENFRELNKIATVFKVEWFTRKCMTFYDDFIDEDFYDNHDQLIDFYPLMRWMVDEALNVTTNVQLLEIVVEKFLKISDRNHDLAADFVLHYLDDFSGASLDKLDIMIKMCGDKVSSLVSILHSSIYKIGEKGLSPNSRYLLEHIDLVKCRTVAQELCDKIFDILTEGIDKLAGPDAKFVAQLLRSSLKSSFSSNSKRIKVSSEEKGAEISSLSEPNLYEVFLNVLLDDKYLREVENKASQLPHDEDLSFVLDALSDSKDITDMYMVFEGLEMSSATFNHFNYFYDLPDDIVDKLVLLKARRGFSYIHPGFFENRSFTYFPSALNKLLECSDLVSSRNSARIAAEKSVNLNTFFSKETLHSFRYKRQKCLHLSDLDCGFIIKVTPGTVANPELFNIQLVRCGPEYHSGNGFHPPLINVTPEKIHLEVELLESDYNPQSLTISWSGKPFRTYDEDLFYWNWGRNLYIPTKQTCIRFIAYMDR